MINPINTSAQQAYIKASQGNAVKPTIPVQQGLKDSGPQANPPVVYEKSENAIASGNYTQSAGIKADTVKMAELQKRAEEAYAPLRQMVEALLKEQGMAYKPVNGTAMDGPMIEITPEIRAEAGRQVAEGGEYSAENTATRLVDFAIAVSGGDKSKFDVLKGAIEKGFKAAEKAFGAELPDISKQTMDLTMSKLSDWANSTP